MMAVRELFGRGNPTWMACHMRLDAVIVLFKDPRMQRWTRESDGVGHIFDGVLDAAATVPLPYGGEDEGWEFDPDVFFAAVEAIYASGKYQQIWPS